jgi:sodium-dependent dicarboxylate transporter 2/3/5
LLLGIAFAANIGGMGSVIGSPPNAIAAGALQASGGINFTQWMLAGLPPALLLLVIAWGYLLARYPAWVERIDFERLTGLAPDRDHEPQWRRLTVMATFTVTILLWMTQALHGIPAAVVSFVPICVLTATRILSNKDVCQLRWDVLLLIAGGLSLGIAVTDTGLASWLVEQLNVSAFGVLATALMLAYIALLLSNLMSNTAAANILVPIGVMAGVGAEALTVVPIALAASAAMALPISTPPNAIVYATEEITSRELLEGGLLLGALAPLVATVWCSFVF